MLYTKVVIIGGGVTGVGILRDLSMRGIDAVLFEQQDLSNGASSHYHGLLHSGGRYVVKDIEAAKECIKENKILKKIAKYCIEDTGGFFVRTSIDSEEFENKWVKACSDANIPIERLPIERFKKFESKINGKIESSYKIPDAVIDGFRLVWQNVASAIRYGGKMFNYTKVTKINTINGQVVGVEVLNTITGEKSLVGCDIVVNATGAWANTITKLLDININIQPDKGTLLVFNHRICNSVINRLRPAGDGDIFVPHGTVTIFGTTSKKVENPDDTNPNIQEVKYLLSIASNLYADIYNYRILRAFAGTRPLFTSNKNSQGREISRGFVIIEHDKDGVKGFYTIVGGKLTTYRFMAEKISDLISNKLGVNISCNTANEDLIEQIDDELLKQGKKLLPPYSNEIAAARLGYKGYKAVIDSIKCNSHNKIVICECENVTLGEIEYVLQQPFVYSLNDIRRKTRIGMGTCQGTFCTYRTIGILTKNKILMKDDYIDMVKKFLKSRWKGIRAVLWNGTIKEIELTRKIYEANLNIDRDDLYEEI